MKTASIFLAWTVLTFAAIHGSACENQTTSAAGRAHNLREIPPAGTSWRLHALVFAGDFKGVKREVEAGADVNALEYPRWERIFCATGVTELTPLQVAVRQGHAEIADFLLKQGADLVGGPSYMRHGVLRDAITARQPGAVSVLAERGLDLSDPHGPAREAFDMMLMHEYLYQDAMAAALLEAGADPNMRVRHGEPLLIIAHRRELSGLFELLLEHGADLDAPGTSGRALLAYASTAGNLEEMARFRELGASLEPAEGMPPLIAAAGANQAAAVRWLLSEGAAIDHAGPVHTKRVRDEWNRSYKEVPVSMGTALTEAAARGRLEVVRLLLEQGASPTARDAADRTAVAIAEERGAPPEALELLLRQLPSVVDLSRVDTPLHMGIRLGLKEFVLDRAAEQPELLRAQRTDQSLLFYALEREQYAIATELAALGAVVDMQTPDGLHVLFHAIRDDLRMARWLLEHSADTSARAIARQRQQTGHSELVHPRMLGYVPIINALVVQRR